MARVDAVRRRHQNRSTNDEDSNPFQPSPRPAARWGPWGWIAGAAAVILIGWLYLWTAQSSGKSYRLEKDSRGYYDLLADGFLSGHLWMDEAPAPQLLQLKDPYGPAGTKTGLHDASLYHGRYYLYFGAAPAVVLFAPFKAITGLDFPENLATALFGIAGVLVNAVLAALVLRRLFPRRGAVWWVAAIVGLGLGNLGLLLMRRAAFWELPIAAASAFGSASVLFAFCAVTARRRSLLWLSLASASYGFAIGSRALYLIAAVGLLAPFWAVATPPGGRRPGFDRRAVRAALAAFLPVGALVGLIFWYNAARFGSPFEFGMTWALTGYDMPRWKAFDWANLPRNCWYYLFAPAHWIRYFPFVQPIGPSPWKGSPAYLGEDNVYGMLPNLPIVLFAAGLPLLLARRRPDRRPVGAWVAFVGGIFGMNALVLLRFSAAAGRYLVDFVPYLSLLGLCGAWAALDALEPRRILRRLLGAGVVAALAVTVAFNLGAGFQAGLVFELSNPAGYARVAGCFNRLPAAVERLAGYQPGRLQLRVRFPQGKPSHYEPLVTTGWDYLSDILYVKYGLDGRIEFGCAHLGGTDLHGRQVRINYAQEHTVDVEMGSMYPPASHPWFRPLLPVQAARFKHRVTVRLDGQEVLSGEVPCFESDPRDIRVGRNLTGALVDPAFTGSILQARRIPTIVPPPDGTAAGPLRLLLRFPTDRPGQSEPLVTTGSTGRGDVLLVTYDAPNRIHFAHDHWGHPLATSAPVECEPGRVHVVDLWMDSLAAHGQPAPAWVGTASGPGAARPDIAVRLDGRVVWSQADRFYASTPAQVTPTQNLIGSTSCSPGFTGAVEGWCRLGDTRGAAGPEELVLQFPDYDATRTEVVLSCGRGAQAARLLVRYQSPQVRLVLAQAGMPDVASAPLAVDPGVDHLLTFDPTANPLVLRLDGRELLRAAPAGAWAAFPVDCWLGDNPPGERGPGEEFSGRIYRLRRLPGPGGQPDFGPVR